MGCDIHLHFEVKINGIWEHWSNPHIDRDYSLFAKMANVRTPDGIKPISEPKGLPNDLTRATKFDCKDWEGDGHSYSWFSLDDIVQLAKYVEDVSKEKKIWYDLEAHILHCYLLGNSFAGIKLYPEDRPEGIDDVRFVFWFDN